MQLFNKIHKLLQRENLTIVRFFFSIYIVKRFKTTTIYLEGDVGKHFFLVVDATTFDILENSLGEPSIYARQAALKIAELSTNGELSHNAVSVWC